MVRKIIFCSAFFLLNLSTHIAHGALDRKKDTAAWIQGFQSVQRKLSTLAGTTFHVSYADLAHWITMRDTIECAKTAPDTDGLKEELAMLNIKKTDTMDHIESYFLRTLDIQSLYLTTAYPQDFTLEKAKKYFPNLRNLYRVSVSASLEIPETIKDTDWVELPGATCRGQILPEQHNYLTEHISLVSGEKNTFSLDEEAWSGL